jgi:Cu/Ag efflux protein CusF
MKTKTRLVTTLVFLMAMLFQIGCASVEESGSSERRAEDAREIWQLVTVTATVEAVNLEAREVTLRGPLGNVVAFTVDKQVNRLDEIKIGDRVRAEYYVSLATEIREPTAAEKDTPLTVLEGAGTTPPGATPAAGGLSRVKAVVTVEGIDRPAEKVTLKGPLGNYLTVRVLDPSRLDKVSVGDTVIVTYTEALAISIEKVGK